MTMPLMTTFESKYIIVQLYGRLKLSYYDWYRAYGSVHILHSYITACHFNHHFHIDMEATYLQVFFWKMMMFAKL